MAVVVGEVPAAVWLWLMLLPEDVTTGDTFARAVSMDDESAATPRPREDPLPARVNGEPPLLVVAGGVCALLPGVEVGLLAAGEVEVVAGVCHGLLPGSDGFLAGPAGAGWDRFEFC